MNPTLNLVQLVAELTGQGDNFNKVKGIASSMTAKSNKSSIRDKSDKYILNFPLVASDSLSIETVQSLRNRIELERAQEFVLVLNNEIKEYDEKEGFLSSLHKNYSLTDSINLKGLTSKQIQSIQENMSKTYSEMMNESSVNSFSIPRDYLKNLNEATYTRGDRPDNMIDSIADMSEEELDAELAAHKAKFGYDSVGDDKFNSLSNEEIMYGAQLYRAKDYYGKERRNGPMMDKVFNDKKKFYTNVANGDPEAVREIHKIYDNYKDIGREDFIEHINSEVDGIKTLIDLSEKNTSYGKAAKHTIQDILGNLPDDRRRYIMALAGVDENGNRIKIKPQVLTKEVKVYETKVPRMAKWTGKEEKKLNMSLPTFVTATMRFSTKSDEYLDVKFGVKVATHGVSSDDIIFYLTDSTKRSNFLSRIVRFTSGELRFFNDFILDRDRSKRILRSHKENSRIWKNINTIYSADLLKRMRPGKDNSSEIPTISMAITMEEVENIRLKTGINILTNRGAMKKLYEQYMLVDFYVIDEASDVVYKYMSNIKDFEKFRLNTIIKADLSDNEKGKLIDTELNKIIGH